MRAGPLWNSEWCHPQLSQLCKVRVRGRLTRSWKTSTRPKTAYPARLAETVLPPAERYPRPVSATSLPHIRTKTFTDPRLCAAIIDRLSFGGNIIETGTDSCRRARTKAPAERANTG